MTQWVSLDLLISTVKSYLQQPGHCTRGYIIEENPFLLPSAINRLWILRGDTFWAPLPSVTGCQGAPLYAGLVKVIRAAMNLYVQWPWHAWETAVHNMPALFLAYIFLPSPSPPEPCNGRYRWLTYGWTVNSKLGLYPNKKVEDDDLLTFCSGWDSCRHSGQHYKTLSDLSLKKQNQFFDNFIHLLIYFGLCIHSPFITVSHPLLLPVDLILFIKSPYCFHVLTKEKPLSLIKVACMSMGVRLFTEVHKLTIRSTPEEKWLAFSSH